MPVSTSFRAFIKTLGDRLRAPQSAQSPQSANTPERVVSPPANSSVNAESTGSTPVMAAGFRVFRPFLPPRRR